MHRREFLGVVGAASVALAGCLGNGGPGAAETNTSDPATATPTETPTRTTTTETERRTTTPTDTTSRPETPTTPSTPTTTPSTTTRTTETDAPAAPTGMTTAETGAPTTDDRTHEGTTPPRTDNAAIQVRDTAFTVESDTPGDGGDAGGSDGGGGTDESGTVDGASVAFDAAANRVVVTGTIVGENGCQTATLESVRYDAQAGLLTITIGTERDAPEDAMCTMALVELSYEATVSVEGGLPERVSVIHRGAGADGEVVTATRER